MAECTARAEHSSPSQPTGTAACHYRVIRGFRFLVASPSVQDLLLSAKTFVWRCQLLCGKRGQLSEGRATVGGVPHGPGAAVRVNASRRGPRAWRNAASIQTRAGMPGRWRRIRSRNTN